VAGLGLDRREYAVDCCARPPDGLVTYGEFISTPYRVGIEAGVDALLHMSRYELGVIPDELQRPLAEDAYGAAANTAYDYSQQLPPTDLHLRAYARFVAAHHAR